MDTGLAPTFTYAGTNLVDANGNGVAAITNHVILDKVAPRLLSRETRDTNANGKIDAIRLTFSENLNTGTGGLNVVITGYTVTSYSTTCEGSTAGDATLCVVLTEKPVADTDAVPAVQIISNTTLGDTANNMVIPDGGTANATDTAGPVIIGARYDAG